MSKQSQGVHYFADVHISYTSAASYSIPPCVNNRTSPINMEKAREIYLLSCYFGLQHKLTVSVINAGVLVTGGAA